MLKFFTRFGDQGTSRDGNPPDTDGTAAGSPDSTVAGAGSLGWFDGIDPGFTLPAGIKQPEQRALPSSSSGPGQGGDNPVLPGQIVPAGLDGGGQLSVDSAAAQSDASSVSAPFSVAQPQIEASAADAAGDKTWTPLAPVSAGLHINLIADANNVNAPAGWAAAVQTAASIIEQNFSDPVTINLRYGYASFNNVVDSRYLHGGSFASGAAANSLAGTTGNYTTVSGWLVGDRTTTDDFNSYDALPDFSSSFPGGANNFYVPNGELRALGQLGNNATVDGAAVFGADVPLNDLVPVAL